MIKSWCKKLLIAFVCIFGAFCTSAYATCGAGQIDVEKTNLLYAPVRNPGSDTITGDAEIWIVK